MKNDSILEEIYKSINSPVIRESLIQHSLMTPEEKMEAIKVVKKAIFSFKQEDPYLYEYIMNWMSVRGVVESMSNEQDPDCPTMQTNGPTLQWNPAFVKDQLGYNFGYVQAILVHEVLHVLFNHHKRFSFVTDEEVWKNVVNVACDLAINQMIQKTNIKLPTNIGLIFLDSKEFAGMNLLPDKDAMYYYTKLIKAFKDNKKKQDAENVKNQNKSPKPPQPQKNEKGDQDDKGDKGEKSNDQNDLNNQKGEQEDSGNGESGESEESGDEGDEGQGSSTEKGQPSQEPGQEKGKGKAQNSQNQEELGSFKRRHASDLKHCEIDFDVEENDGYVSYSAYASMKIDLSYLWKRNEASKYKNLRYDEDTLSSLRDLGGEDMMVLRDYDYHNNKHLANSQQYKRTVYGLKNVNKDIISKINFFMNKLCNSDEYDQIVFSFNN